MSIHSKARRDAKKRKAAKAAHAAPAAPSIEPHAELRGREGQLLGGIVRRDGEWTLGLDGRIVGGSDSAAKVLIMLKRAAALHEREGQSVRLTFSPALSAAAAQEAADRGLSFEQFEAEFEKELAEGQRPSLESVSGGNEAVH
ncbi:hypothetical protein [Lysobacter silvisoli]|uniref:Uncharacterized protein n=1 Tax=Lysobacter silvisoli TaxID=2293254 RepID=A0A371K3S3_9GAMM|nr:hypothetical protein [Lysobacter silvisoli]RDZ28497.1 hypothetical protein DX914_05030 [Lysobacter silvisoli]